MRPFSDINTGDVYQNIILGPNSLEFMVVNKNKDDKMIEVVGVSGPGNLVGKPFWKKNTDRLFTNRTYCNDN